MGGQFAGKTAVVTGRGSGIGKAVALALAAEGANVVVNDLTLATAQAFVDEIKAGGGSIVNTSSILGLVGEASAVPYVTAKHGAGGMTKAAALGYASQGIRINSVHPGYIDTPLLQGMPKEAYDGLVGLHPIGR